MLLTPIHPIRPGNYDYRLWSCNYCGETGRLEEVRGRPCKYVYPPCPHCGQTPECALDCPGIVAALAGGRVHVAGFLPPETQRAVDAYKKTRSS